MPYIAERADMLITVSHYSRRDIIRHLQNPPEKIAVIYAAPEPIYVPLPQIPCREFLRERYGIAGEPLILYVGGFSWREECGALAEGLCQAKKELGQKALLVMPGKATLELEGLRQLARGLGIEEQVIFPGYVPVQDLPQSLRGRRCLCLSVLIRRFRYASLEAMACGRAHYYLLGIGFGGGSGGRSTSG